MKEKVFAWTMIAILIPLAIYVEKSIDAGQWLWIN